MRLPVKENVEKKQLQLFYGTSLLLILIDQWTKHWAQSELKGAEPIVYWQNLFRFEYAENPGAFLGMGTELSDPGRFWIFTIFVLFLMVGLAVFMHWRRLPRLEMWAYTLIFAGGIGNLIDRMFRHDGRVIDFMNMGVGELRTGIFNVADMAIMLGLIFILLTPKKEKKAS